MFCTIIMTKFSLTDTKKSLTQNFQKYLLTWCLAPTSSIVFSHFLSPAMGGGSKLRIPPPNPRLQLRTKRASLSRDQTLCWILWGFANWMNISWPEPAQRWQINLWFLWCGSKPLEFGIKTHWWNVQSRSPWNSVMMIMIITEIIIILQVYERTSFSREQLMDN